MKSLLISILLLAGCATTPQGKSVELYQYTDIGTTLLATASDNGIELNPLMPYIIPLKLYIGKYIDSLPCEQRRSFQKVHNPFFGGLVANNFVVALGAPGIVIGLLAGTTIAIWQDVPKCEGN
ncbi:MAG TPA: hypothetical protein ENI67_04690 [Gammaproteobacteria bacterium]|nr:hypothetical protein [Gammaproteobacteria bacterium]